MSSKDKQNPDEINYARLHDGWAYVVVLIGGAIRRLNSQEGLDAIYQKIVKPDAAFLCFDGARDAETDEDGKIEVGPVNGRGYVRVSEIASVAYLTPHDDEPPVAAIESARAFFDVQRDALLDVAAGETADEEEETDEEDVEANEGHVPALQEQFAQHVGRRAAKRAGIAPTAPAPASAPQT